MTDRYRITPSETRSSTPDRDDHGGLLRPVLWALLVVSAAANATVNTTGGNALVGVGFGLITLTCTVVLVMHHYRHRAR
ncbi:hypothetical protein Daura_31775 [Dactylosporangium aurantiacum]|uniref:Uncharacterized protein n=1 Tax=Dactylosporangium aurantiacum TaxID=35754 RepID=A0A9Q9IAA8_9ACTN|nr:hypothetical protein [Dactylosporangium aurantiacum]MDG6109522.1 hypothetical protein [Dactylosporangium aurantiacum]UWZ51321.1 hypothetical protein Daura_31775 [Dactylosporangium aurantiacum]